MNLSHIVAHFYTILHGCKLFLLTSALYAKLLTSMIAWLKIYCSLVLVLVLGSQV